MASNEIEKKSKKEKLPEREREKKIAGQEIDDDDDDEETRLRDRLLARRAKQLQELIAKEPSEDPSTSSKKSSHHHHHKKKKRRHGSTEEIEEIDRVAKSSDRLPSIVSTVTAVHQSTEATAIEEEGLNIKPPQAISSTSYQKRHKKRGDRDEVSPYYKEERTDNRYQQQQQQHRSGSYETDRRRHDKADEGWSTWKKSLDRPQYGHSRGGAMAPISRSGGGAGVGERSRSRSPSAKTGAYHGHRGREGRMSPPPSSSSNRLVISTKSASGGDRPRSGAVSDQHQIGRGEKRKDEERHYPSVVSKVTLKRIRPEVEAAKSASTKTPISAPTTGLITVISPEATPTMDEIDDLDAKHTQKSSETKARKSSRGDTTPNEPPAARASSRSSAQTASTEDGKSNRSSMESGEHRSDEEKSGEQAEHDKGVVEMKKSKYSKFESSSSESSSESGEERDTYDRKRESEESNGRQEEGDREKRADGATGEAGAVVDHTDFDVSPAPEFEPELALPIYYPALFGCRSVEEFHSLNRIEEGTYGVVYRAKEKRTDEVVALKRLKMEKEKEGFPITSLREINMLLKAGKHPNVVKVREIVVGSNMDKIYLVMDYVEHDLKSLMETMKQPFMIGEVKTLLKQLLAGVKHLHENWILHRDLKTSNLLLSHKGILKIADFGLAREYGSPLKACTPIVVTLWYRAPELLLGISKYSTPIDVWSVGCIFAEMLTLKPFFTGKSEIEQLNRIFKVLGTPNESIWPGYNELPGVKRVQFVDVKFNYLRKHFDPTFSGKGFDLLNRLFTYDPEKRVSAAEALDHEWFKEEPRPVRPDMFPTWPAKSEQSKAPRKGTASPKPPSGGKQNFEGESDKEYMANLKGRPGTAAAAAAAAPGFSLKFDAPKFQ